MIVDRVVYDGLEFVRKSGLTNMFDFNMVCHLLKQFGYQRAYEWVSTHKEMYAHGLLEGFDPVDDMFSQDEVPKVDMNIKVLVTIKVGNKVQEMNLEGEVSTVESTLNVLKAVYRESLTYEVI